MKLDSFKEKFDIQCSYRKYSKICHAVPAPIIQQIQNTLSHSEVRIILPDIRIGQIQIGDNKCSNKVIRNKFKEILFHDLARATNI